MKPIFIIAPVLIFACAPRHGGEHDVSLDTGSVGDTAADDASGVDGDADGDADGPDASGSQDSQDSQGSGCGEGSPEGHPGGVDQWIPEEHSPSDDERYGGNFTVVAEFIGALEQLQYFAVLAVYDLVVAPGTDFMCGRVLDTLQGSDDCGLVWNAGLSGSSGSDGEWDYDELRDPEVVVDGVTYSMMALGHVYVAHLGDAGLSPAWGGVHGFRFDSEILGTLEIDNAVRLVPDLQVQTPTFADFPPISGDQPLPVRWEAADGGDELLVSVVARPPGGSNMRQSFRITCTPIDDGSFEIPAELLRYVPQGWEVKVDLRRRRVQEVETGDGRLFYVRAEAGAYGWTTLAMASAGWAATPERSRVLPAHEPEDGSGRVD
ncbi:MAG: hypothetical protein V3V08_04385 [Nannocystaceae bacterium]